MNIEIIDDEQTVQLAQLERVVVEAAVAWDAVSMVDSRTLQEKVDTDLGTAVKALLAARAAPACDHNWTSAVNEVVTSGSLCVKCGAVRAEGDTIPAKED
jgi:hypothetical protein